MNFTLDTQDAFASEALIFLGFEKESEFPPNLRSWLKGTGSWLAENPGLRKFSGRKKTVRYFFPPAGVESPAVILAGLGERKKCTDREVRQAMAAAVGCGTDLELASLGLNIETLEDTGLERGHVLEEAVCAASMAAYRFEQLKTEEEDSPTRKTPDMHIIAPKASRTELLQDLEKALAVNHGRQLARDLVNMPSNMATPEYLADAGRDLAQRHGYGIEVLDADQIQALGMGAFAAVFRANREQARLIILDTHPQQMNGANSDESAKPLVLIGKGITFDTGGISLKPSQGMEEMKGDMAGAAAVLGFFDAYGRLGASRRVIGIIPCTENVLGSRAIKPGEVVTTYSGKSVEIVNTDAEGRLLLCDALAYSKRFAPVGIVDLATLTGAMVVALGPQIAGAFTPREQLADLVRQIGEQVGEPVWPMPLWDGYMEELKSEVADLKNVGAREGGAIHAALFLERFVPENTPWIHLDIAGPAFTKKKGDLGMAGGSGFGVRTLMELVRKWPEGV